MRIKLFVLSCLLAVAATGKGIEDDLRRFAAAYLGPRPGATVTITIDKSGGSWAGPFLVVTALRTTGAEDDAAGSRDQLNMLVDVDARRVVAGAVMPLQVSGGTVTRDNLAQVAQQGLPQVLGQLTSHRTVVRWPATPARDSAVVPLTARVSTGYGSMKVAIAVTADASYLAIGGVWPLGRDPREVRRERLAEAEAEIQWDPGHESAPLQLVEFSDYQCPGCKSAWGSVEPVLDELGAKIRHGLVNFPLVSQHPWAFRAAVAGVCIGSEHPELLRQLKKEIYLAQDSLTADALNTFVIGFAKQNGVGEAAFRSCYLRDDAIEMVHRQLAVGWSLGILATPTYLVNGEVITFKDAEAAKARLTAILEAGGIPERAD